VPAHSFEFAAAPQATKTADGPILLRTDASADRLVFADAGLGMAPWGAMLPQRG
jgi:hypothetical protein